MIRGTGEIIEQAEHLFRNDGAEKAIGFLTLETKSRPEDLVLQVRLADYFRRDGRTEQAIDLYSACAVQYAARGELPLAVALYKLVVPLLPPQSDAAASLARELSRRYMERPQEPEEEPDAHSAVLSRARPFRGLSEEELAAIIKGTVALRMPAGTILFQEGDEGASLNVVVKGVVRVTGTGADGGLVDLARLGPGDFFGEWSFLTGERRRHARVEAETEVELLELNWHEVEQIAQRHPRVREVLQSFYHKRRIDTLIAKVLPTLTVGERRRIAEHLTEQRFPAGALIYREGDPSESMSLIAQGTVEVFTSNLDGSELSLATFEPGHYFGEGGALSGYPRTASVRAVTDTMLYQISREDLVTSLVEHPELLNSLAGVGAERIGDTLERLEGSDDFELDAPAASAAEGLEEETA